MVTDQQYDQNHLNLIVRFIIFSHSGHEISYRIICNQKQVTQRPDAPHMRTSLTVCSPTSISYVDVPWPNPHKRLP